MFRKAQILVIVICGLLTYSCRSTDRDTRIEIPLNSPWEFREVGASHWFPARIPGSLASDIYQNSIKTKGFAYHIKDISHKTWEYRTIFDVSESVLEQDVVELCFKGIDAHANIYLNDSLLLRANDKYQSWLVSCKSLLKAKGNVLSIILRHNHKKKRDSLLHSKGLPLERCVSPNEYEENGGVNTLGIYKPVYLQAWSAAKISKIALSPDSISSKRAVYDATMEILSVENQNVTIEVQVNRKVSVGPVQLKLSKGHNNFHTRIVIDKPKFWWANGLGNPDLYAVTIRLKRDQETICEAHQRIGVRTIELMTPSTSFERGYYLKLNGIPVFLKGAVYSTSYLFDYQNEPYKRLIEAARQANFNMMKSETIEDELFYDLCDENGIMVWQEFPARNFKACIDSVENERLLEDARRFQNHASVALLSTDNRNMNCGRNGDTIHARFFKQSLPGVLKKGRVSLAYADLQEMEDSKHPANIDLYNGKFVGNIVADYEFSPSKSEIKPEHQLLKSSASINGILQRSEKTSNTLETYIQQNFPDPKNKATNDYIRHIAQAELLKSAIENHRLNMPACMGTVYKGLNGHSSFATIDSSGKWLPAQYTVKDAFSHILVIPNRNKDKVDIYVVSDAFKDMDAFLLVRLIDFYGNDLFVKQIPIDIKANSSTFILSLKEAELLKKADKTRCCLVVQVNQASKTLSKNMMYFTELKNLYQPKYSLAFDVNEVVKGYNLILRSPVLVKNLVISTNTKECRFSDNNIDLLPGKRIKINLRYNGTKAELLKDLHFISLADLK